MNSWTDYIVMAVIGLLICVASAAFTHDQQRSRDEVWKQRHPADAPTCEYRMIGGSWRCSPPGEGR